MRVSSAPPLAVASFVWQPRAGAYVRTVICTATYALRAGVSPLVMTPAEPLPRDLYWDDNPLGSIHTPTDFVPFKRGVDIVLGGHAHAPHGQASGFLVARFSIGTINKAIAVYGDRHWMPDGRLSEPAPFKKMPLRWERTAGGPKTWNPVGIPASGQGSWPVSRPAVPNLEPVGFRLQTPAQLGPPVGFGALAPHWPARAEHLRHHGGGWMHDRWHERPLPPDVDAAYFNVAPPDQQLARLPPQVQLTLVHLHPEIPGFVTVLEDITPVAVVSRSGSAPQELGMRCDTLCVDTDIGTCTLTWRASVALMHALEDVAVVVSPARRPASTQAAHVDPPTTAPTQLKPPAPAQTPSVAAPSDPVSMLSPSDIVDEPTAITLDDDAIDDDDDDRWVTFRREEPSPLKDPAPPSITESFEAARAGPAQAPDIAPPTPADDASITFAVEPSSAAPLPSAFALPFTPKAAKMTLRMEAPVRAGRTTVRMEAPSKPAFDIDDEETGTFGAESAAPSPGPALPFKGASSVNPPPGSPGPALPFKGASSVNPPAAPPGPALPFKNATLVNPPAVPPVPALPFKEASSINPAPAPPAPPAPPVRSASSVPIGKRTFSLAPGTKLSPEKPILPFRNPSSSSIPPLEESASRRAPVADDDDERWATLSLPDASQPSAGVLPFAASSPTPAPATYAGGPPAAHELSDEETEAGTLGVDFARPGDSPLPFKTGAPAEARQTIAVPPFQLTPAPSASQDVPPPEVQRQPPVEAQSWSLGAPGRAISLQPVLSTSPPAATPFAPGPTNDAASSAAKRADAEPAKAHLSIEQYARIKMQLWGGEANLAEVLERHGVDEVEWRIYERRQADALAEEGRDGRCDLALALMAAFEASNAEASPAAPGP